MYHFLVTVTLTSFLNYHVRSIFFILFELGILNLVCGCILGWQCVIYHFCDLDLIYTIIVSGAYLILFEGEFPNLLY